MSTHPTPSTAPVTPLPETSSAALQSAVHAHLETLAERLAQGSSLELLAYLAFLGRFHRYSLSNQMLIALQAPEARHVAGFHAWKALGRHVRKGAKAIRILAPCTRQNSGGEREVVGFKSACVFADFDTEGEPLPSDPSARLEGGDPALLARALERCPYRVKWAGCAGAYGMTDGMSITLDPQRCVTPAQRFATLTHEWAHCLLHFEQGTRRSRAECELEADAASYALCALSGLETTAATSDYLTAWGARPDALRAALERITRAVRLMASALGGVPDHAASGEAEGERHAA